MHTGVATNVSGNSIKDRSNLLALAIMLLEVCLGQPIEQIRSAEDLGASSASNDMTDLSAAHRWHLEEKARGNLSFAFSNSILGCLQAYLNPDANFSNPDFCQTMREKILEPLEEEMQFLLFGPPA